MAAIFSLHHLLMLMAIAVAVVVIFIIVVGIIALAKVVLNDMLPATTTATARSTGK